MQSLNQQDNNQDAYPQSPLLNRNQKLAVVFLFVFTLGVVGYGTYQFKANLISAIDYSKGKPLAILDDEVVASSTDAHLKNQDTDKDSLNDWEELNIYETSPFLEDTDGDGIKDADEIKNGTNPKCQEGKDCSKSNFLTDVAATGTPMASKSATDIFSEEQLKQMGQVSELIKLQTQLGGTSSGESLMTGGLPTGGASAAPNKDSATKILNGQADVKVLRQELLKAGMSEVDLTKIPDDILMQSYSDILNKK